MKENTILFISHDASRTGAPISLLRLLTWLKSHTDLRFRILLKKGGTLEPEFAALAPTDLFYKPFPTAIPFFKRGLRRLGLFPDVQKKHFAFLKRRLAQESIRLIYANTFLNGDILEFLSEFRCPVLCHVREMEYSIRYSLAQEEIDPVLRYTDTYIAVSEAVKANLIRNHGIAAHDIRVIHNFIPTDVLNRSYCTQLRVQIRHELNIPEDAALVCASGTTDWRKGTDLFIQLARTVHEKCPERPVYFVWIGGDWGGKSFSPRELQHDLRLLNLQQFVRFPGVKPNPLDYFAASDIFVLTSREDPFPLVCLEAASTGKPVICFEQAGGAPEFVANDAGFVVPYLDVNAMADKILTLLGFPNLLGSLGNQAKQKVQEHHDIQVIAPKIIDIIQRYSGNSLSPRI